MFLANLPVVGGAGEVQNEVVELGWGVGAET